MGKKVHILLFYCSVSVKIFIKCKYLLESTVPDSLETQQISFPKHHFSSQTDTGKENTENV